MIIGLIEIEEWSKSTQPVYLISSTSGGHRRGMIKVYLIPPSTDLLPALQYKSFSFHSHCNNNNLDFNTMTFFHVVLVGIICAAIGLVGWFVTPRGKNQV